MTATAAESEVRPTLDVTRVVSGTDHDHAGLLTDALPAPKDARRNPEKEILLFLFNPLGGGTPRIHRQLRAEVRDTYWWTSGSMTAALRRAMSVANKVLLDHNLKASRPDRCYGGLALVAILGGDIFLLQAGPAWACLLQGDELSCFPRGEKLSPLGIGPVADLRLHHALAHAGDTLLLAPHTLLQGTDQEHLRRALSQANMDEAAASLRGTSADGFSALVIRWKAETHSAESGRPGRYLKDAAPVPERTKAETQPGAEKRPQVRKEMQRRATETPPSIRQQRPGSEAWRAFRQALGTAARNLGKMVRGAGGHLLKGLTYVWHGLAASGAGILVLAQWMMGAALITVRSMLPGSEPAAGRRRRRSPPPKENARVLAGIAIAIPLVILISVILAYRQFAAASRFQGLIKQAEEQTLLARAADTDSETARSHWEAALQQAEIAATLQPEAPIAQTLQAQAQKELDQLDRVERLSLTRLTSFGSSSNKRRLLPAGQTLFVLDAAEGWVSAVPLGSDREAVGGDDDNVEREQPVIARTGQQVEGHEIGQLIDGTWVGPQGGRRSSALLVLEEHHDLVSYDPAWRTEAGAPQLSLLELSSPHLESAVAVGSYQGQFYILDATGDGGGQIWRYKPEEDGYPNEPERYFSDLPPRSLEQALDMAIDGNIYLLYQDRTVDRFLGGERQPFDMQGIPGGARGFTAFDVDPEGDGTVYLADPQNERIIALTPEGHFQGQYRTDPPLTSMEAIAVDQAQGRLYLIDGGDVYRAALP
ncbi:MAG: hypothetical protein ACOC8C_00055 [Chloroflexota bacterium]